MAGKASTRGTKTVAKRPVAVAKRPATAAKKTTTRAASSSRASKGENFICGTCGLSVIVDEWGDVYGEELICCGKPMKQRAARKAKVAAK